MEGESREMLKIGDIYAGKPDAGDEIKECGYEEFANIFIHPTGVNIGRLASTKYGTPFFIMGDKGTGKGLYAIRLCAFYQRVHNSTCFGASQNS